jgi:NADPH:quinone reductase-like Zn-dependent oxidoreductase
MKAVVLAELGGPEAFQVREWPTPEPGPDEVLVAVVAAGLNRRDAYVGRGLYPGVTPKALPGVPGSDGAGRVVTVGTQVRDVAPGDEVIINPALGWGGDPRVAGDDFQILGFPRAGTFAEYVTVPAVNVAPKPRYLSWEEAAALPLGALTAYRALFVRGGVKTGETVLVPGAGGGVATLLIQMAARAGARVAATTSREDKGRRARELGAAVVVDYTQKEWSRELRRELGTLCDVVVDGVGGDVFPDLVRLVRPGGRIVSYGATRGPVPSLVLPTVFLKQVDVLGTTMGSPEDFRDMLTFVTTHEIRPVIDEVMPFAEAAAAIKRLEEGRQFGKLVLRIRS